MKSKRKFITMTFILLFILLFFDKIVGFIIDIKWFKEIGYLSTYFIKLFTIFKFIIPLFLLSFVSIWIYCKSLKRSVKKYYKILDINKSNFYKKIFIGLNILISFTIAYIFSNNYWYRILQFKNSINFNVKDPIFFKDVSFYIFKLPLIESIYGIIMTLLIFLVIITVIVYFILNTTNKIYIKNMKDTFSCIKNVNKGILEFAGKQLAIISSLIVIFLSLGYLIKSWNLVYSQRGIGFGASYTDVNVTLMFYRILIISCIIIAIIIFWSVIRCKVKPIFISIFFILILILGENVTSNMVQNLIVKSNEKTLESKYIKYNIDYTRKAFNLDKVEEKSFEVKDNLTKEDIKNNKDTINNIRINSFKPALEFYNQVQTIRYYYIFNNIDIDRYNINGKYTQVFVSPREVNTKIIEPNTWQNRHLIYTHGYGIVMNKVNSVTKEGQPNFVIKDMPLKNNTKININNPRIYFGEKTNEYAIVNTKIDEVDYPRGSDNKTNQYNRKIGMKMNIGNRILFAINKKNINFLLSKDIKSESRILINRNIKERLNKIAPFLSYDSDPYIVVHNGHLCWIIDAYCVSNRYPFSQSKNNINYIRNSVKVVIDAIDGETNFYIIDKNDPIIKNYSKIFPNLFKDESKIPKDIKNHFKYPKDLFKIQCETFSKYHILNSGIFYNGEDVWEISKNQKQVEGKRDINEAPYVIMKLPKENKEEMVLLEYFNMRDRDSMSALFCARMDEDNYGKLMLYKFPPEKTIYSPYLFKQKLNQDTIISKELSLWNKEGSQVQFGDTIIVPINNSLLYIEPVYLRASGKNSIPEVKKIIVSYSDKIVLSDDIKSGLEQIFNYKDKDKSKVEESSKSKNLGKEKLDEVKNLYNKAIESQKNGDWGKYGEYIDKLGKVLNEISN